MTPEQAESNKALFFATPPQAWNIGAILPESAVTAEFPQTVVEVYPAGSMRVRYHTGRTYAAALVFHDGKLVAVLWPEQIGLILSTWMKGV